MYTTLTDSSLIARAQRAFEERVQSAATRHGAITVGYQGGGRNTTAHYLAQLGCWVAFADSGNRYWNALGLGNPFKDDRTIVAEINPPKSGINRRLSGVFIQDGAGAVYLAHRGRIGGGRQGIGRKAFLAWYANPLVPFLDGDRLNEAILIGALDDQALLPNLATFIRDASTFKDEAVSGQIGPRTLRGG